MSDLEQIEAILKRVGVPCDLVPITKLMETVSNGAQRLIVAGICYFDFDEYETLLDVDVFA